MIGYPYFYEADNLNQDENFMIFSLDTIFRRFRVKLSILFADCNRPL